MEEETLQDMLPEEKEDNTSMIREEFLKLPESGDIKCTQKYLKKASEKTLRSILSDHERRQLNKTNEHLTNILITKVSELIQNLEMVEDCDEMERELSENTLLQYVGI